MSLFVFIFFWGGLGPNFSKDAVPDASDRKRKVRPGRPGVDAYGRQVPSGAEGAAVDFGDWGGTEIEVTWLQCKKTTSGRGGWMIFLLACS